METHLKTSSVTVHTYRHQLSRYACFVLFCFFTRSMHCSLEHKLKVKTLLVLQCKRGGSYFILPLSFIGIHSLVLNLVISKQKKQTQVKTLEMMKQFF